MLLPRKEEAENDQSFGCSEMTELGKLRYKEKELRTACIPHPFGRIYLLLSRIFILFEDFII